MQLSLNNMFKQQFISLGWESKKDVFGNKQNDLVLGFLKRNWC